MQQLKVNFSLKPAEPCVQRRRNRGVQAGVGAGGGVHARRLRRPLPELRSQRSHTRNHLLLQSPGMKSLWLPVTKQMNRYLEVEEKMQLEMENVAY